MGGTEVKYAAVSILSAGLEDVGQRIDNFLLRELKGVPRSLIYRLIRKGEVRVNKGRVKPNRRLEVGDQVRVPPLRVAFRPPLSTIRGFRENIEKTVLYEDERLLVINKRPGWAVHGGSGIASGVIEAWRAARPAETQLELVHRLDRETSGCLMIAKRRSALRQLQVLQRERAIVKRYVALLRGRIPRGRFQVDAPLQKNLLQGGERLVRVDPRGKPSLTSFAVTERYADSSLVKATLVTGRTHQIRVHAAHAGHPLVGDPKYGDPNADRGYRELGFKRLFLHAAQLALPWGEGQQRLTVTAPLPMDCEALLAELRSRA